MEQATVVTQVAIDVGPDGIRFTFEGMDKDLAELIHQAMEYEVLSSDYHTVDSNTIVLRSKKMIAFVERPSEPTEEPIEEDVTQP